jgi:hypothetical protein
MTYCLEGSCSIQLSYETELLLKLLLEDQTIGSFYDLIIETNSHLSFAERGGFEPPVQFNPYDSLANYWFQPLTHLSVELKKNANIRRLGLFQSPNANFYANYNDLSISAEEMFLSERPIHLRCHQSIRLIETH